MNLPMKPAMNTPTTSKTKKAPPEAAHPSKDDRGPSNAATTPISELMTRDVVTVGLDMSVESLVEVLLERDLSRVPVVDNSRRLVGVVSKTDLVSEQQQQADTHERETLRVPFRREIANTSGAEFRLHLIPGTTVGDVMHKNVLTIPETASVADTAKLMAVHHLHGVPVVSGGQVVGFVSPLDVLAWVAGLR
jgi:CBS domain-containing protein